MNEITGLSVSTIHRLFGPNGRGKASSASTKESGSGLLIADEMPMVSTWLTSILLKAIPTNMQITLVGDKDQFPPVGPGQALHDLLETEQIPKMELNQTY